MTYRVFIGFDTSGNPMYKWNCDCDKCLNTTGHCVDVLEANLIEREKKP